DDMFLGNIIKKSKKDYEHFFLLAREKSLSGIADNDCFFLTKH
ncbi:MAG: hypothetical protein KR126chlam5_01154, partial [Candidatus Anoxychlamydiales bacterium]|nr:hypothetical protein [Candidatus Anoxychlamydiales bacterium]